MLARAFMAIGLVLAVGRSFSAHGQSKIGSIYHADNNNGAVVVFAENHGFVPYTVLLRARLTKMHSSDTLPARFVVFPSKSPRVLTSFTYIPGDVFQFDYSCSSQYGIYSGHAPDSSYVYALPFQKKEVVEQHFFNEKSKRKLHHHYFFNLPKNTPVRAAREGIIAEVRQGFPFSQGEKSNHIIIFHDDGTYAEYTNFNQNSAAFQMGQRVAKGEIICYASGQKRHWLRFCVQYPGAAVPREVPVLFGSN